MREDDDSGNEVSDDPEYNRESEDIKDSDDRELDDD